MAASSTDAISSVTLSLAFLPLAAPISDAKVLTGRQKPLTEVAVLLAEIRAESGLCCGDGEGVVAEAGDEVQPSAECVDVAGDCVDGSQFAAFDLGYPAGDDAHGSKSYS
jgi:hypothetical protein